MNRASCLALTLFLGVANCATAQSESNPLDALMAPLGGVSVTEVPLSTFCDELEAKLDHRVEIVVTEEVADRPVSLKVQNVTGLGALNLLSEIAGVQVRFNTTSGFIALSNLAQLDEQELQFPGPGPLLLMINEPYQADRGMMRGRGAAAAARAGQRTTYGEVELPMITRVYNVSRVLEDGGLSLEDVLTAVRMGWPPSDDGSEDFRVNPETGLLVCRGPESALDVVEQVLWQLKGGADAVMASLQLRTGGSSIPLEQREHVKDLERELARCREEMAMQRDNVQRVNEDREQQLLDMARELESAEFRRQNDRQQYELEVRAESMEREVEMRSRAAELGTERELLRRLDELEERRDRVEQENDALRSRLREMERRLAEGS